MTVNSLTKDLFSGLLRSSPDPFVEFIPETFEYAGWKFTIIGSTIEDSIYLLALLGNELNELGIAFKSGTDKLIKNASDEQKIKLMTIYNSVNVDSDIVFNILQDKLIDYSGHIDLELKHSEHVQGAIWKRRDIDEDGMYIPATESNLKV